VIEERNPVAVHIEDPAAPAAHARVTASVMPFTEL
jgi:hypothetical protein